jgi:hypothetical protein
MDPRAGLNDVEKLKFLTLLGLEIYSSGIKPLASHCTDYITAAHSET